MDGNITPGGTERSLYLTQIRYLEEQLDRCELRYDELEAQNNHLTTRCAASEEKEKMNRGYLKCYMNAKEMTVDHLYKLEIQHQDAQKNMEVLKLQHSQEMQTLQRQVDELNTRILMQAAELEKTEEHLLQLKQRPSEIESVQKQLEHQKEEHEAVINNLKKEAESEKMNVLEKLQDDAKGYVETETEKVLLEVRAHLRDWSQELVTLQGTADDLQREGDEVKDRESAARTKRDEKKNKKKEMARKIKQQLKVVRNLKNMCVDQKEELKNCDATIQQLQADWEVLRYELPTLHEQNCLKTAELDQLEAELQRLRRRVRLLEGVKREAATILRHIMTIRTQRQDQDKRSEIQWKMERLVEILESAAPQGPDSTFKLQKTSSWGSGFAPPWASLDPDPDPEAAPLEPDGTKPENN